MVDGLRMIRRCPWSFVGLVMLAGTYAFTPGIKRERMFFSLSLWERAGERAKYGER